MKSPLFFALTVVVSISYATSVDVDFTELQRCSKLAFESICSADPTIYAEQLELAANCTDSEAAVVLANQCTRDSDSGLYCGALYAYVSDFNAILATCSGAMMGGNCSEDCKNRLIGIRDELGCCINAVVNTTSNPFSFHHPAFASSLWRACGVASATSNCTGELSYTIASSPPPAGLDCSYREIYDCNDPDFFDNIQRNLDELDATCQVFLDHAMDTCSTSEKSGTDCFDYDIEIDIITYITPIQSSCAVNQQTCSDDCKQNLQQFVDARGCCLNSLYNSTFGALSGLNFTFLRDRAIFTQCGVVPPPPSCHSSGSIPFKASIFMLLSFIIVLFGIKIM